MKLIPGVSVERSPPGDPDIFPAIAIDDGGHRILDREAGSTWFDLTVILTGYLEGDPDAAPEAIHSSMHDLYEAIRGALITEPPLDGLATTIDEGDMAVNIAALASHRRLSFELQMLVEFSTPRGGGTA
ncbi:MAG: hypothetical protein QHC65_16310 [Sphingomonas sp.]|nr:hypothetical protein [Sphingomonas sp.]MDX3885988.1 hypothetical protein [Sphingomonas sp.]